MKSMVTDDDKIDKLTQRKTVSEQYCWGSTPNTAITNFEEKGCFPIVDMSGAYSTLCVGSQMST